MSIVKVTKLFERSRASNRGTHAADEIAFSDHTLAKVRRAAM
jgi:hypothetical protein